MKNLNKKNPVALLLVVCILMTTVSCGITKAEKETDRFVQNEIADLTESDTEINLENTEDMDSVNSDKTEISIETVTENEKDTGNTEQIGTIEQPNIIKPDITIESDFNDNETHNDSKTEINNTVTYTYTDFLKAMYAIGTVNVRKSPNTSGEKVGTLYAEQMVEVTGQCNETSWYRINYNGTCAYVSNNYLTEELKVNEPGGSWVKDLDVAQTTTQIIVVAAEGTHATVSMHTKDENGIWNEDFSTSGRVGKNGIGKTKEGDGKTPVGVYKFNKAFGILSNPGISSMPYLQVDETHHWVDDPNSAYYNQCVSTRDVVADWNSSEHLYKVSPHYNYALALNYNEECKPNAGSAIFLHCASKSFGTTAGCIAISESYMIQVMKNLRSDCIIIIDNTANIYNY